MAYFSWNVFQRLRLYSVRRKPTCTDTQYYRGLVFQAIEQQKKLREAKNNQAPDMQAKVYQKKQ